MRFNNPFVLISGVFSVMIALQFSNNFLWEEQPVWAEWGKLCACFDTLELKGAPLGLAEPQGWEAGPAAEVTLLQPPLWEAFEVYFAKWGNHPSQKPTG